MIFFCLKNKNGYESDDSSLSEDLLQPLRSNSVTDNKTQGSSKEIVTSEPILICSNESIDVLNHAKTALLKDNNTSLKIKESKDKDNSVKSNENVLSELINDNNLNQVSSHDKLMISNKLPSSTINVISENETSIPIRKGIIANNEVNKNLPVISNKSSLKCISVANEQTKQQVRSFKTNRPPIIKPIKAKVIQIPTIHNNETLHKSPPISISSLKRKKMNLIESETINPFNKKDFITNSDNFIEHGKVVILPSNKDKPSNCVIDNDRDFSNNNISNCSIELKKFKAKQQQYTKLNESPFRPVSIKNMPATDVVTRNSLRLHSVSQESMNDNNYNNDGTNVIPILSDDLQVYDNEYFNGNTVNSTDHEILSQSQSMSLSSINKAKEILQCKLQRNNNQYISPFNPIVSNSQILHSNNLTSKYRNRRPAKCKQVICCTDNISSNNGTTVIKSANNNIVGSDVNTTLDDKIAIDSIMNNKYISTRDSLIYDNCNTTNGLWINLNIQNDNIIAVLDSHLNITTNWNTHKDALWRPCSSDMEKVLSFDDPNYIFKLSIKSILAKL